MRGHLPKGTGGAFAIEPSSAPFVSGASLGTHPITLGESLEACRPAGCDISYSFDLDGAARTLDDVDTASLEGDAIVAPPSTWLAVPTRAPNGSRVRFSVQVPAPIRFVSGAFLSKEPGEASYEFALSDLEMSAYSAFGRFETRTLSVAGASLEVARASGALSVSDDEISAWSRASLESVAGYFGQAPIDRTVMILLPGRGPWVGGGKTLAGGGASIVMRVGDTATKRHFDNDWVLTHELCHLAGPSFDRNLAWIEEGLATYVEPVARVHASRLSETEMWRGLFEGLENGRPQHGDRGLDNTATWGRIYWGGAAFFFVADVEIRKATQNKKGLIDALRGVLKEGGSNLSRWEIERWLETADRSTATTVFRDLHQKMGQGTWFPDLAALANDLGVRRTKEGVTFDDRAPLSYIRRAITRF